MRYRVLGPVRVWQGATELKLGPPKQQALLALLLVRAPDPLPVHEAVDVLWGEEPPDSAVNVVHRHIGALRRLLEPGSTVRADARHLSRTAGGYRLAVDPGASDLLQFRELRAEAHRALDAGAREQGARILVEALRLWHGPVAAGLSPQMGNSPVFVAVDNECVAAVKEAADAVLAGAPALVEEVLTVLRRAAEHRPLDEAIQSRIVTALAATGRQAEALALFDTIRADLDRELGVEPSAELRAAHEAVLRRTGGVGHGADDSTGIRDHGGLPVRPAQLPAAATQFAGRESDLARVQALLDQERPDGGEDGYPPVVIAAVSGMAGVGKTTLAVHWAHTVADRFPDGQLYVDLRGFHPQGAPVSSSDAMREVIDALGGPLTRIPENPDALAALYRSLFVGRRYLILLDNARDSEQVRPLLPGAAGCLAIITSRHRLDGLVVGGHARFIPLGLVSRAEGIELLARRLGQERVRAELSAAEAIVDLCGRLPLALAIASARAVLHPEFGLASIAAELRESQGRLDAFASRDTLTDARSVFSWSYEALSPGTARMFRLLSLHPATDVTVPAAAGLAGVPPAEARQQITELVEHHLLNEHLPSRFTGHDLLRAYAAELCADHDSPEERDAAIGRMCAYYLHSVHAAEAQLTPHRDRVALPPAPAAVRPREFADRRQASSWWRGERQVLLAVVERAGRDGRAGDGYCWQLAQALEFFLDRHGRWQEQRRIQTVARDAARRAGDPRGEAYALRALGFACCRLGSHDEARRHLSRALAMLREIGDPLAQGRTLRYLAYLANVMKDHRRALDHYREASDCYAAVGYATGQATVRNEIGWSYILMGDYEYALAECEKAVAAHQEGGDRGGEAAAWDSLGYAQHHLGRFEQALESYGHALHFYRENEDVGLEADTLVHMGDSHRAGSRTAAARESWRQALTLYEGLDHPDAERVRERLTPSAVTASTSRLSG